MHRRDRRLQCVRSDAARGERAFGERDAFVDQSAVPARPLLVFEEDQVAVAGGARRAPRLMQQHQR